MEHPSPFWAATALAEFVRERASWRRTQAQRFPDDARNIQSADALEQLAMHVEALPDTDRSLIELIELEAFDDQDRFIASEEARRAIARWGFGDATSHMRPRDLLRDLVAITRRARRPANERNSKVTSATPTRAIPELPTVLWFKARSDRGKMHAAKDRLAGNLVRTYCGDVFDFPEDPTDLQQLPSPYAGACPLCEFELDRFNAPLPQPGKHELSEPEGDVMYDLLTLAHATDPECQVREKVLRDAIAADPTNFSDELGAYVMALTKLHAAIAPAALARLPILAPLARKDDALIELLGRERKKDLERFLAPLFTDAGLRDPFARSHGPARDVLMTLEERRALAIPLRAVRDRIGAMGVTYEPKTHRAIETDLNKARDLAQRVPAAVARIDDATQQVRVLAHRDAIADQHLLHEAVNRVKNAMDTILDNLVPEDVLDGEPSWDRRRVLEDVIVAANTGDVWAIDLLKARPHLAWYDETSKKWLEQVDSGRGPGIAVSRDRIIRTRRPSE